MAIENVTSIAGMVLMTECAINDIPEPKEAINSAIPNPGMNDGMMPNKRVIVFKVKNL